MIDTDKIKRCAPLLPAPGDKVVLELVTEIELLHKFIDHLLVCAECADSINACETGREILTYCKKDT